MATHLNTLNACKHMLVSKAITLPALRAKLAVHPFAHTHRNSNTRGRLLNKRQMFSTNAQKFQRFAQRTQRCAAAHAPERQHAQGACNHAGVDLPSLCSLSLSPSNPGTRSVLQRTAQRPAPLKPYGEALLQAAERALAATRGSLREGFRGFFFLAAVDQRAHDTYLSACSASSRAVNLASRNSAWTSSTSPRATSSRPARFRQ